MARRLSLFLVATKMRQKPGRDAALTEPSREERTPGE
jgi:hypothetical protein